MIKLTNADVFTGLITWGNFYDEVLKNNTVEGIKSILNNYFLNIFVKMASKHNDYEKVVYNDDVNTLAVMFFDYYEGH